ncbi:MAG: cupin domain-containing protein [Vulcanococcus sp.]
MNVVRMTVPAGVTLKLHQHPVIHAGVLVQGRLRLEAEQGASQLLEPGQAVIEVVNRAHRSVSLGPDPAVLLIVFVGPKGTAITLPATP